MFGVRGESKLMTNKVIFYFQILAKKSFMSSRIFYPLLHYMK